MKKILSIIAVAISTFSSSADNSSFHLSFNIPPLGDTVIVVNNNTISLHAGSNGKFELDIPVTDARVIIVASPGSLKGLEDYYFRIPAVAGERAEVSGTLPDSWNVSGSNFYQDYNSIKSAVDDACKAGVDFMNNITSKLATGQNRDSLRGVYQAVFPALKKAEDEKLLEIIKNNSSNEASACVIAYLSEDVEIMEKGLALLSDNVRNGRMKSLAETPVKILKEELASRKAVDIKQAAGIEAPDFTLNDPDGKPLTLSNLRGRYVLLNFWGSWCRWCIKSFPKMKEYYEKYKGKFEILGIACNDTDSKWRTAIKEHSLPWLNVYNNRKNDKVIAAYGIKGFPTKILVSPDGRIVKTFTGEDPAFYSFMDATFGN